MKYKTVAALTLQSPRLMSERRRRLIAQWLKKQSLILTRDWKKYTEGRFRARYLVEEK